MQEHRNSGPKERKKRRSIELDRDTEREQKTQDEKRERKKLHKVEPT